MKRKALVAFAALGLSLGAGHAAAQQGQRGHGPGHLTFASMDTDHDGTISLAEFKAEHEAELEAHFKRKDANGDGVLSKEELANWRAHRLRQRRHGNCGSAKSPQ